METFWKKVGNFLFDKKFSVMHLLLLLTLLTAILCTLGHELVSLVKDMLGIFHL